MACPHARSCGLDHGACPGAGGDAAARHRGGQRHAPGWTGPGVPARVRRPGRRGLALRGAPDRQVVVARGRVGLVAGRLVLRPSPAVPAVRARPARTLGAALGRPAAQPPAAPAAAGLPGAGDALHRPPGRARHRHATAVAASGCAAPGQHAGHGGAAERAPSAAALQCVVRRHFAGVAGRGPVPRQRRLGQPGAVGLLRRGVRGAAGDGPAAARAGAAAGAGRGRWQFSPPRAVPPWPWPAFGAWARAAAGCRPPRWAGHC
jgi:hypothetical protein